MNYDLKIIKNKYGEKMMHLCRELFPTLLEEEGLLSSLMLDNFYPSRDLYDDIKNSENIESFKNYIYNLMDIEKESIKTMLTPKELMKSIGYNLYECKTEKDIRAFRKYYKQGEELCTFTQGNRLDRCYVFFAVKENVDEIKREDFSAPEREDIYGRSVISIQFTRGNINTLSIKNRYNHTVTNPDATFSNNLENIVPGLTDSFEREYKLNINQNDDSFELPGYVKARDGKYYKYNYEINNIYYCPDNIIIDNFQVKKYEEEKYIVLDYFILDLVNKKIILYDSIINDSFIDGITNIDKISIEKDKETGNKKIEIKTLDNNLIIIKIDKQNNIIGYENNKITTVARNFLNKNKKLEYLNLSNVEKISDHFLDENISLKILNLPKTENIGSCFLHDNENIGLLNLPKLKKCGYRFLCYNQAIEKLNLPELEECGADFLRQNTKINNLNLPKLKIVGDNFLLYNKKLKNLNLPSLKKCGNSFLGKNSSIEKINLPALEEVMAWFLDYNEKLTELNLPNLKTIGAYFISNNEIINQISMPNLEEVSIQFLKNNDALVKLSLPNLKRIAMDFLYYNTCLMELDLPNVEQIGSGFLHYNKKRIYMNAPKLKKIFKECLTINISSNILLKKYRSEIYDAKDLFNVSIIKIKKANKFIKTIISRLINRILKKEDKEIKVK